jgi:hypothetical protein
MKVRMRIKHVKGTSLDFALTFHGAPDPLTCHPFHGITPLHPFKGLIQATIDRLVHRSVANQRKRRAISFKGE